VLLTVVSALALVCAVAPARAADPFVPNLNWTALLPPVPGSSEVQPGPVPHCETPSIECIDVQIERMTELRDRLGCDHRAVFATTYLELTKEIRATVERDPGVVDDLDYLFTEDALFANMYFDTVEGWDAGARVPPAWRIAFEQAERGHITGAQEMLLGINAHVQNDMAFVLAALGLRSPDGASRKPDHDAMNVALNTGYEAVVREVGTRYDPTMRITNAEEIPADNLAGLEMARTWREVVWRNAERLAAAPTEAARDRVASSIEANAAMWARGIAAVQTPGIRAVRDRYCMR
jgi:hypothetical protein